ncbi:uncharacterized protein N7529_004155 [Penicillium soppii]|uniref:uncharacterized protein n=1 Tax=Penicillium soppii TaxID=69789 RepID=UPI0025475217|nr:uncharacterized protein N7529_004155 [Penicillium soppii]KAJ5871802.1 hypothetical protein N7529_004155 [Penicillium soppii]
MSAQHRNILTNNVSVPLDNGGVIRCNVYKPKAASAGTKSPVLMTCRPCGKDVPFSTQKAFLKCNPTHQTEHSAWETPTSQSWTINNGYIVIRADKIGIGQSPGVLQVKSSASIEGFRDVIDWAAEQEWCSGKVGLLGVSYYAAVQWQVASLQPKGLGAIVLWEGSSDLYSESLRHGGILLNKFYSMWYSRQVAPNLDEQRATRVPIRMKAISAPRN